MDRRSLLLLGLFTVTMFFVHYWFSQSQPQKPAVEQVVQVATPSTIDRPAKPTYLAHEKKYVLENDYQQIVFSSVGGAITEINLPFKTKENTKSIILPIEFDTDLKNKVPDNAMFPNGPYYIANDSKPKEPSLSGYYPLLRRDLSSTPYTNTFYVPPEYYSLNVISDTDDSLAVAEYSVKKFDKNSITFELNQSNRKISKTYHFAKSQDKDVPYSLILDLQVEGDTKGLYLTSGVTEVELLSNSSNPDIKYHYKKNKKSTVELLKLPKKESTILKGIHPEWICTSNGFFGIIINPQTEALNGLNASMIPGEKDPTRLTVIDAKHDLYPASKYPGYLLTVPLKASSKPVSFRIFAGPFDQNILAQADTAFKNSDFAGAQSFHGWFAFISEPFAKFLLVIMKFFYSFTHSWVAAIVLLTLVLKVILYPLNNWSTKSMARMQMIAPEVQALQEKFSKDPKRKNLEIMQLYRDKGVSPFSAFLPMFIQMPFLMGMFDLLKSAFQLRGSSFIPGWIDNLTAPDVLFSWSYPIPFIGTQFHLLPIILGALMYLQQKCSLWMDSSKALKPEAKKQGGSNMITIVFTVLFYHFPSGLNIYWISSTAFGILQQLIVTSKIIGEKSKKVTKA